MTTGIRKQRTKQQLMRTLSDCYGRWAVGLGTRKFALTRSSSSSRVALSLGKRPLWSHGQNYARQGRKMGNVQREATCAIRRPSSLLGLIKSALGPRFC